MKILYKLDSEFEEIDPIDPLGDIIIYSNKSNIVAKPVYIDSWLNALLEGYKKLNITENIRINIPDEPEALFFNKKGDLGWEIKYKNQFVMFKSIDNFQLALKDICKSFITLVKTHKEYKKNTVYLNLEKYIEEN